MIIFLEPFGKDKTQFVHFVLVPILASEVAIIISLKQLCFIGYSWHILPALERRNFQLNFHMSRILRCDAVLKSMIGEQFIHELVRRLCLRPSFILISYGVYSCSVSGDPRPLAIFIPDCTWERRKIGGRSTLGLVYDSETSARSRKNIDYTRFHQGTLMTIRVIFKSSGCKLQGLTELVQLIGRVIFTEESSVFVYFI